MLLDQDRQVRNSTESEFFFLPTSQVELRACIEDGGKFKVCNCKCHLSCKPNSTGKR